MNIGSALFCKIRKLLFQSTTFLRDSVVVLAISLFLFIVLNIACAFLLNKGFFSAAQRDAERYSDMMVMISNPKWVDIFTSVTGVSVDEAEHLKASFDISSHTVLDWISIPIHNAYINVGIENIRWPSATHSDEETEKILRSNNAIWCFGGSTTFGALLKDDQTWPSHLDRLMAKEGGRVLNFGVNASTQNLEINKLVYLLKKGYRPKHVIFFDGLNDVGLVANNYAVGDVYTRLEVIAAKTNPNLLAGTSIHEQLFDLIRALPIFKAYHMLKYRNKYEISSIREDIDSNLQPFDVDEQRFIAANWIDWYFKNPAQRQKKYVKYFRKNVDFIDALSRGFGFKYTIIYQPNGMLDIKNNPFLDKSFEKSKSIQLWKDLDAAVRAEINNGSLKMVDFSKVLSDMDKPRYTDPGHYTSWSNERIALQMRNLLMASKN